MSKNDDRHLLKTFNLTLDKAGGFILPPEFCAGVNIQPGDEIVMLWKNDEIVITKARKRKDKSRQRKR